MTFNELAQKQSIIIFDNFNGSVDIAVDGVGFWGSMSKKYVQKVLREQGRDYKKMVCHQTNPF